MNLSTDKNVRKEQPIARGVLDYFPNAIAEVARVSFIGNQQHNPGEEMHWAKDKSRDHADCIARHMLDRGTLDNDGLRHTAKIAWRALALLQIEIEADQGTTLKPALFTRDIGPGGFAMPQDSAWQPKDHNVGYVPNDSYGVASNPADSECATSQPLPPYQGGPLHAPTGGKYATTLRDETDPHKSVCIRDEKYKAPVMMPYLFRQDEDRTELAARLRRLYHCPADIAKQIAGGTTFSYTRHAAERTPFVYIAGPMRGLPGFNFAAFDAARDCFVKDGYHVISPADIDRVAGDELGDELGDEQAAYFLRDMFCLYFLKRHGDARNAIYLLPGWQKSRGAAGEFFGGRWLDLKFLSKVGTVSVNYLLHDFALRNSMATTGTSGSL